MQTFSRRSSPSVVSGSTTVTHTLGETGVLPSYRFTSADGEALDLSTRTGEEVVILCRQLEPVTATFTESGVLADAATGLVEPSVAPTVVTDEMYGEGLYSIQYRVGDEGGPYVHGDIIYIVIANHGPGPLEILGGIVP